VPLSDVERAWPGEGCDPRIGFTGGGIARWPDTEYPHSPPHATNHAEGRGDPRMRKLLIQAAVAVSALAAAPALAQPAAQWPDHPVKMIVPLGACAPADLVGRYIAQQLGEKFKQSFFIENRPGASGII